MATITLTATGLTSRAKTISAADTTRLLNAYRTIYGQVPDGLGGFRDRTDQEIFNTFADGIYQYMQEAVRNVERDAAAKAINLIVMT